MRWCAIEPDAPAIGEIRRARHRDLGFVQPS